MVEVLETRRFPVGRLVLLASARSAGSRMRFRGEEVAVRELRPESFAGCDIALFSAGAAVSREFAPRAWEHGCPVIDNSSAFRMEPDVPLVVPEVNPAEAGKYTKRGIIANPNCSTIQLVHVLKPLHDEARLKRLVVATYQSVSGGGQAGMDELARQTGEIATGQKPTLKKWPHPIAFNVLPQCDDFVDGGYTKEEMKVVNETRKILGEPDLRVTATAVRVPVLVSHSEAVNAEFERPLPPERARELLRKFPGIEVVDDPANRRYPLAIEAAGKYPTFVGRIRQDFSVPHGLNLWVVADNLLKGAALNAVQIAELLVAKPSPA